MKSMSAGSVSLMRLRETSLEALQFCCNMRISGRVCSVMGCRGGGGGYHIETERRGLGVGGHRGGSHRGSGLLPGSCAGNVSKGEWGVCFVLS